MYFKLCNTLDDNSPTDDDDDASSTSYNRMIIGVTVGPVSAVALFLLLLCMIYKKCKKKSLSGHLQCNSQHSSWPRYLQPPANNPSHQNTNHNEQHDEQQVPMISGFAETPSITPAFPPPYNPSYDDSDREPSPVRPMLIPPNDVPPYPPPDYASANNYPLLSSEVPPPDYVSAVPTAAFPHVTNN